MNQTDNDYFKMGAVVAVGELLGEGLLGNETGSAEKVRGFLTSFGVTSVDDMRALGMGEHYLGDFQDVYETA